MIATNGTAANQIIIGVAVGLILLSVPVLIRLVARMHVDLRDIKGVLITAKPTGLVPHPAPGLVDVVAGLAYTAKANLAGTGALVAEKAGNGSPGIDVAHTAIDTEQSRLSSSG